MGISPKKWLLIEEHIDYTVVIAVVDSYEDCLRLGHEIADKLKITYNPEEMVHTTETIMYDKKYFKITIGKHTFTSLEVDYMVWKEEMEK